MFVKRALISVTLFFLYSLLWGQHSFAQSSSKSGVSAATALARDALPRGSVRDFGEAPAVPKGALSAELQTALDKVFIEGVEKGWGDDQEQALKLINESKDPRIAWIVTDLLRFSQGTFVTGELEKTLETLLNFKSKDFSVWHETTNRLMAWNIPEPPNYLKYKGYIFTTCLLYTSPSPRDQRGSRMPSSA